jgi:hypothetical protein
MMKTSWLALLCLLATLPAGAEPLSADAQRPPGDADRTPFGETQESTRADAERVVEALYRRHLGRGADPDGLRTFSRLILEEGKDAGWVANALRTSEEGQRVDDARQRTLLDRYFNPHVYFHVLVSLGVAIALGFVISQVYKHTHRGMNFELSFMSTLVLLAPVVTLVMMYIRGDLVLSLGLIGSLSIIRFRTPIKDSRDMIFLFWTIAVGLGAGTNNWLIVLTSSFVLVPLVFLLYFLRYGRSRHADFVLICAGDGDYPIDQIQPIIHGEVHDAVVRSHEVNGDAWETVFELRRTDDGAGLLRTLVPKLRQLERVRKVSLLAPKLDLPV